jgi:RNA polymerase sigma-70 factor (ECF subfamily)
MSSEGSAPTEASPQMAQVVPKPLDEESFQNLYERYNRSIYYFFANRGFSREESRDLVQDTFLAAYDSRTTYRGEASAGTWLFAIATNIWRMAVRGQRSLKRNAQVISFDDTVDGKRSRLTDAALADDAQENQPLKEYLAGERVSLLRRALSELPEKMRLCVILRLKGLKYREVATVMKVSVNTVRSQLFDARDKLREQLADHFTGIDF